MTSRNNKPPEKSGTRKPQKGAITAAGTAPKQRQRTVAVHGGQAKKKASRPAGIPSSSSKTASTLKKNVGPTSEDLAAVTIQCAVRQFIAKRKRIQKSKEKQDYEALMDRLEKEAFVALVRREQDEAARERKKEEEQKQRKKEELLLRTRLLEAAFDGEKKEVLAVLKEVTERDTKNGIGFEGAGKRQRLLNQLHMINAVDANGNTAVSEAAGGGQPEVIAVLVERGADVNTKGAFGRTPLYRAAFGGHLGAIQTLLQLGADPRMEADDGCTPEQVAAREELANILKTWDLSLTDSMLVKMAAEKQRKAEEEQRLNTAETDRLKGEVESSLKEHERCQRELQKAYAELNKRITEHDKCTRKGMDQATLDVTLQVVHDAEDLLASAQLAAQQAAEQLSLAKLTLREQSGADAVVECGGVRCLVRDLDEVVIKDVGDKIKNDGRWPLLVDPSGQAATFLRYRDTNYMNAMDPDNMKPDKLRLALLGAIRFGKPLVIDMMEVDMFETVENQLEQVKPGLSKELMSKELLREERYLGLVRSSDGPQYARTEFRPDRVDKFSLVLISKQLHPPDALLTAFYPIEISLPQAKL